MIIGCGVKFIDTNYTNQCNLYILVKRYIQIIFVRFNLISTRQSMPKQKLRRFDVLTIFPEIITPYAEALILE
jgi:hypothetical protein